MRWSVEIGRIDINLEITFLFYYLFLPKHGHLDQVFHTLSFLKSHAIINLVLDTFKNNFDGKLTAYYLEELYGELQEGFPENTPEARGESVTMTMTHFIYANHAIDMMNSRSHTVILIYLCRDTII